MPNPLRMDVELLHLKTRHPFIIARGGQSDYRTVWVRLTDGDGLEGWGEAAPSKFYSETAESVLAALEVYRTALPDNPLNLEEAENLPPDISRKYCNPDDDSASFVLSEGIGFMIPTKVLPLGFSPNDKGDIKQWLGLDPKTDFQLWSNRNRLFTYV